MPYLAFLHSHVTSWVLGLILFVIAFVLLVANKPKGLKIVHMILRLFYILIIVTGVGLLFVLNFPFMYVLKGLLAIWLIYAMEMILSKGAKGKLESKQRTSYLVQIVILTIVILLMGYGVI